MVWLEAYWSLFAQKSWQDDSLCWLQNANLPILEVNAGYGQNLERLVQHARRLERPCLLVTDTAAPGWQTLEHISLVTWQAEPEQDFFIEQVAWSQASHLAEVWCRFCNADDWQALVALEIAKAMQRHKDLSAYLAYVQEKPIGMALAMAKTGWWHNGTNAQWFSSQPQGAVCGWWAGEPQIAKALFQRIYTDFAGLEVVVPNHIELPEQPDQKSLVVCIAPNSHGAD